VDFLAGFLGRFTPPFH